MINYTGMNYSPITIVRRATLDDRAKYAPRTVKMVQALGGLPASTVTNKRLYWLFQCQVCGVQGVVRSDRMSSIKCKPCNRHRPVEHEPRTDHSSTFHGDFTVVRRATLQDRQVFAPRSVCRIDGVLVSTAKDRYKWWLYHCDRCDAFGVCRTNRLKILRCKGCGK